MSFFKDFKNDLSMAVNNLPNDNSDDVLDNKAQADDSLVLDDFGDIGSEEGISVDDLVLEVPTDDLMQAQADTMVDDINVSNDEVAVEAIDDTIVEEELEVTTENVETAVIEEAIEEPVIEEAAVEVPVEIPVAAEVAVEPIENNIEEDTISGEEVKTMSEIDEKFENAPATDDNAIVTEGMKITGDITSTGNMDVLGAIKGNIDIKGKLTITGTIEGNSKAAEIFADSAKITGNINSVGAVKVGQSSVIVGDIVATSAVIAGAVKGNIDVHGPVILDTSAIVMGDIKSKSVQINNGAVIEGHCSQCYAEVSPTSFFNDVK